jgi:hypothetical protein
MPHQNKTNYPLDLIFAWGRIVTAIEAVEASSTRMEPPRPHVSVLFPSGGTNYVKRENFPVPKETFFKLTSRLICLTILILGAFSLMSAQGWQSGLHITCSYDDGEGSVTVVGCGSSAGNYIGTCSQMTNSCTIYDDPVSHMLADNQCALYNLWGGCNDPGGDEGGGHGGILP